mgnify:CR=1 FL=1
MQDDDLGSIAHEIEESTKDILDVTDEAPIIRLVNSILAQAVKDRVSDIHIEPYEKHLSVRFRKDGILREVLRPPRRFQASIASRIKIMGNLNIAEKRLPQDGRIRRVVAGKEMSQISMSNDWADSLVWLSDNTPDPGVGFDKIYQKTEFSYPDEAYGILSWWDYGHWITFLGKRIPVSSPFQDNVPPVARFLSAKSEEDAEKYAEQTGAEYVIIDYATVTSKFTALPLWGYGKDSIPQYEERYFIKSGQTGRYDPVKIFKQPYFESTAVKLHLYDGSYTQGLGGRLLEIEERPMSGGTFKLIGKATQLSLDDTEKIANSENRVIGSNQITEPITDIPALGHYRLIYESPTTVLSARSYEIKEVKIFERVRGFTYPGEGTIELPIVTNQGRNFTWQQKSVNGTFTLPYSTKDNPYDVKSTGPYRIIETGKTIEVSEDQVN